jgi:hypothetical protein
MDTTDDDETPPYEVPEPSSVVASSQNAPSESQALVVSLVPPTPAESKGEAVVVPDDGMLSEDVVSVDSQGGLGGFTQPEGNMMAGINKLLVNSSDQQNESGTVQLDGQQEQQQQQEDKEEPHQRRSVRGSAPKLPASGSKPKQTPTSTPTPGASSEFEKGARVQAVYPGNEKLYAATVTKINRGKVMTCKSRTIACVYWFWCTERHQV